MGGSVGMTRALRGAAERAFALAGSLINQVYVIWIAGQARNDN